jgi:glycosyltransferase involved in cell wall biosynthesis
MNISFNVDVNLADADSGKHRFLIRLAKSFKDKGAKITDKNADVHLFIPSRCTDEAAKIKVLRLDGLIFNSRWNHKTDNKHIQKHIKLSDALVYQGQFCKDAYKNFLGINKESKIIHNAADPSEFVERDVKNYFLANCKWRPHKRLKYIIKSFLIALDMGLDADLVVTGKPDYKHKHKRIKYKGWVGRDNLKKYFSESIASIHLSWLDWFPNAMVEAIVAKCPIIYTDSGGHRDVAKDDGIVIKDIQWDYKICDLYSPPKLDLESVAKAMIISKNGNNKITERNDLDIDTVSVSYLDYFEKLLKKDG